MIFSEEESLGSMACGWLEEDAVDETDGEEGFGKRMEVAVVPDDAVVDDEDKTLESI